MSTDDQRYCTDTAIADYLDRLRHPWFRARRRDGGWDIDGTTTCLVGHKLPAHRTGKSDGVFAEWHWDGTTLCASGDRYGFCPLFYSWNGQCLLVSPSLGTLVRQGAPTKIDESAVFLYMKFGYFLGEDTPFSEIKVLPPDGRMVWNGAQPVVTGERVKARTVAISRDDAIEKYISLFSDAIKRRLPANHDFAVPLSGGRDSRHILLELCRLGYRPAYCLTSHQYPPFSSREDIAVASQLCRATGIDHRVISFAPRFEAEYRKNVDAHFSAEELAWYVSVADYLTSTVSASYDGIAGDLFESLRVMAPHHEQAIRDGDAAQVASVLLDQKADLIPVAAACSKSNEQIWELSHQRLTAELQRFADEPSPVAMFIMWNRTRREIALKASALLHKLPFAYCPYVDHELFDFLLSLPPSLYRDGTFHMTTIQRAYPAYAHIPFGKSGLRTSRWTEIQHYGGFASAFTLHLARKSPASFLRQCYTMAQWVGCLVDPRYRRKHRKALSPARLLYLYQLTSLIEGR